MCSLSLKLLTGASQWCFLLPPLHQKFHSRLLYDALGSLVCAFLLFIMSRAMQNSNIWSLPSEETPDSTKTPWTQPAPVYHTCHFLPSLGYGTQWLGSSFVLHNCHSQGPSEIFLWAIWRLAEMLRGPAYLSCYRLNSRALFLRHNAIFFFVQRSCMLRQSFPRFCFKNNECFSAIPGEKKKENKKDFHDPHHHLSTKGQHSPVETKIIANKPLYQIIVLLSTLNSFLGKDGEKTN